MNLHQAKAGLQGFGQMLSASSPALNWLGKGARPFLDAEAAPGTYYVPSKHPYQATLADGIKVQEAYPGQYYTVPPEPVRPQAMSGLGATLSMFPLPYPRWVCALVGAVAGASAGYGGTYYYAKRKVPPMPAAKKKKLPAQVAVGGAIAGAVAGYFLCGPGRTVTATQPPTVPGPVVREPIYLPTQPDIR